MNLETQFKKTLEEIGLSKKDKILVAISGGKDSTTTAYLLKKFGYNVEGFHIDLKIGNYSDRCLKAAQKLCKNMKIKLYVYDVRREMGGGMCYLRQSVQERDERNLKNCAICGVIKKWIFNKKARELKAKYIATGHNLDDEVETILLNICKGDISLGANFGVVTKNKSDKKFIPRIKPLFYLENKEIRKYSKDNKLPVVYDKCPCALDSYRIQIREFAGDLTNKKKKNILKNFKSLLKTMKKKESTIVYCEVCGEPARKKICKKCELLGR